MCKMIHVCFSFRRSRRGTQQKFSSKTSASDKDGFDQKCRSDARVVRAGSSRAGLRGSRAPRSLVGSSARQAEKTPGVPSRSVPHPNHREHYVSGHRAARLPQEAE